MKSLPVAAGSFGAGRPARMRGTRNQIHRQSPANQTTKLPSRISNQSEDPAKNTPAIIPSMVGVPTGAEKCRRFPNRYPRTKPPILTGRASTIRNRCHVFMRYQSPSLGLLARCLTVLLWNIYDPLSHSNSFSLNIETRRKRTGHPCLQQFTTAGSETRLPCIQHICV